MPYPRCSSSFHPPPRPSSTRPPDIWSTPATLIASGPGSRNVTGVTRVPSLMRSVSRARPASVVHASVEPGQAVARTEVDVVVRAEERVEPQLLGELGDGEQVVVGRALLRLGEDAERQRHRTVLRHGR